MSLELETELAALQEELAKKDGRNFTQIVKDNAALLQTLTAAEQQNAELIELLSTHTDHVAKLCDVMFRFGLGMHKEPEEKIYSALSQQQVVFAVLKHTESGASDA